MKNTYEIEVRAQCPVNNEDVDVYVFIITAQEIIEVERITAFFREHAGNRDVFQEELTRLAAVRLGARVRSFGTHSGVKVTCEAP